MFCRGRREGGVWGPQQSEGSVGRGEGSRVLGHRSRRSGELVASLCSETRVVNHAFMS